MAQTPTDLKKLRAIRDRIDKRISDIEKRTGKKLKGKAAPKPIKRGGSAFGRPSKRKVVIQKKPTSVIGVMAGRETRLKVGRALQ